jgi:integrase
VSITINKRDRDSQGKPLQSPIYVVRWRHEGKSRQRQFPTKKQAETHRNQLGSQRHQNKAVDSVAGRIGLATWHADWTATRDVRATTAEKNASLARAHLLKDWQETPLAKITREDVQAWTDRLALSGLAPSTVRAIYAEFAMCLAAAVEAKKIADTPCVGIRLPSLNDDRPTIIDVQQIRALADAIVYQRNGVTDRRYVALVYVLAFGGLRISEATALRRKDVDMARGEITVTRTAVEVGGKWTTQPPKTSAGFRTIPLATVALEALQDHLDTYTAPDADALVFTGGFGGAVRSRALNQRHFKPAAKRAGLGDLHPHILRHSAISIWIAAGYDLLRVKTFAGHKKSTFTLDRYGHLFRADNVSARAMLDAEIARR